MAKSWNKLQIYHLALKIQLNVTDTAHLFREVSLYWSFTQFLTEIIRFFQAWEWSKIKQLQAYNFKSK